MCSVFHAETHGKCVAYPMLFDSGVWCFVLDFPLHHRRVRPRRPSRACNLCAERELAMLLVLHCVLSPPPPPALTKEAGLSILVGRHVSSFLYFFLYFIFSSSSLFWLRIEKLTEDGMVPFSRGQVIQSSRLVVGCYFFVLICLLVAALSFLWVGSAREVYPKHCGRVRLYHTNRGRFISTFLVV